MGKSGGVHAEIELAVGAKVAQVIFKITVFLKIIVGRARQCRIKRANAVGKKPTVTKDVIIITKAQLSERVFILIYLCLPDFKACVIIPHDTGHQAPWWPTCKGIKDVPPWLTAVTQQNPLNQWSSKYTVGSRIDAVMIGPHCFGPFSRMACFPRQTTPVTDTAFDDLIHAPHTGSSGEPCFAGAWPRVSLLWGEQQRPTAVKCPAPLF